MRSLKYLIPIAVFTVIAVFLLIGLNRNPREIPSPLIGKPAPVFELPQLDRPGETFSSTRMKGQVWLLNVFASWCVPCLVEHPLLLQLARDKAVPLIGFNYKDDPGDSLAWLGKHGNPYQQVAVDRKGAVGLDFGVYGVPETFLIDRDGVIRFKHIGPLTAEVVSGKLLPMVRELSK